MKKKKILLFGGNGFLGSRLIRSLKPNLVIAPSHSELDLFNIKNVCQKIEKTQPDLIIYASGITKIEESELHKEEAFALNAQVPEEIAKFIYRQNIPLIYISTDAVFDGYVNKYMFNETDLPNPKSTYGKSKLKGEEAVLKNSSNNVVVRLITLFGIDFIKSNFLTGIWKELINNNEVLGIVDQTQNPLSVDIGANAISFIVNQQLQGIYHLGSLDWDTNFNFLVKFAEKFNLDRSLVKKISFSEFTKNKIAHRKKKSVLLSNKFIADSGTEILNTIDDSFSLLYDKKKLKLKNNINR